MSDVQFIFRKVSGGEETVLVDGLVAGRLADSGLILTEGHPSRRHAKFSVKGNEFSVEDLGSANGTFVNDQRIRGSTVLRSGDKVRFDIEEFEFHIIGDQKAREDGRQTMVRKAEPVDVDSAGTNLRDRPAWIDPDKQVAGGPKTEFIDAAAMKEMIKVDEQNGVDVTDEIETPALLITSGAKAGLRVNLRTNNERGEWTIGCDSDRDIVLGDQGVSGIHAKLGQDGRRWKLTDQMSANGTFVNGKRSNMSYLDNGDRIRFGPVECVFRTPESFGTATRVTRAGKSSGNTRNIVLAVIAFAITLAILYVVYRVL